MADNPPARPDPRDFEDPEQYQKAMDAYLDDLDEPDPMAAFRNWRENPPTDGWQ